MQLDLGTNRPSSPPIAGLPPRTLCGLGLALFVAVMLLAVRAAVPAEDGVSYLWMAEQFARGEWRAGLSLVFPPGYPLLCAPAVALGVDPEWTGIVVGASCLTAALWPMVRIAESCRLGAGGVAAMLLATAPLFARLAADNMSEPVFVLCMAWGIACGLRGQWWSLGAWAGLAFWVRPEGLLLAPAFLLARRWGAVRALLPAILGVLSLAACRWWAGHGFDPLPMHDFHLERDDLPDRGAVFANLLLVPAAWVEAFGLLGLLPLVLLVPARRRGAVAPSLAVCAWLILLQVLVVCSFVVRRRFFVSVIPAVVGLAAAVLAGMPRTWRRALSGIVVAWGIVTMLLAVPDPLRNAERELGHWLGSQLRPGCSVTGDLARVVYFAGMRPLPPRHFDATQLAAMAAAPEVQFVVLRERSQRAASQDVQPLLAATFARATLPEPLARLCADRLLVLQRR